MSYVFPVAGLSRVSSGIGERSSPGGIGSTNHKGVDLAAPLGTPIVAPTDITIIRARSMGGFGNTVIGQDAFGNQHLFGHLQTIGVSQGQTIGAGGYLGAMGSTGNSTGSHLHYAVRDKAGKFLADKTKEILSKGKLAASAALRGAIKAVPGGEAIVGVTDAFGITGECDLFCQVKKWFKETQFFQRAGLIILAIAIIVVAITMFGRNELKQTVKEVMK